MARTPSPWFREERAEWRVNLLGQRRKLGPHPAGFPAPKKTKGRWNTPQPIPQAFHALMAKPPGKKSSPPNVLAEGGPTLAEIFDKYLEWCQKRRARRAYEWYRDHIRNFLNSLTDGRMPASDLKPFHVIEWADQHGDWGAAYRRGAIVAVQRPFDWAEDLGYIPASPIKKIKKPPRHHAPRCCTGDRHAPDAGPHRGQAVSQQRGPPLEDVRPPQPLRPQAAT